MLAVSVGGFFRAISLDWRLQAENRLGNKASKTMVVDKKGAQIFVFCWVNCGLVYQTCEAEHLKNPVMQPQAKGNRTEVYQDTVDI